MPADIAPAFQLASSLRSLRTLTLDEPPPSCICTLRKYGPVRSAALFRERKTGRRWVFLEIDLVEFVRSLYPVRRQALQVTSQEAVCHLSSATSRRCGGSTSSRQTASEYDDLLHCRP